LRAAGAHCSPWSFDEISLDVGKFFSEAEQPISAEHLRAFVSLSKTTWHRGIKYRICHYRSTVAGKLGDRVLARESAAMAKEETDRIASQLAGDFLEVFLTNPWVSADMPIPSE